VTGSVLFYVQHLLGIGHLRRALLVVDALAREGIGVTFVSGGAPLPALSCSSAERIVQLSPIRASDMGFKDLVDAEGRPIDEKLQSLRRAALLSALEAARPDVVIIEAFPFGRRAFRFELDPLINAKSSIAFVPISISCSFMATRPSCHSRRASRRPQRSPIA